VFLARRWLAWAVAVLTLVSATLSIVNAQAKPSGLTGVFPSSGASVWGKPIWYAQTILRPRPPDETMLRVAGELIPRDAALALAPQPNDFLAPYFGAGLTRHVVLVEDGGTVPATAQWLVASPGVRPRACPSDWRVRYRLGGPGGWLVAQRVGQRGCQV